MTVIKKDFPLQKLNSFGLRVKARYLAQVATVEDFKKVRDTKIFEQGPVLILGGGSNILFTRDFNGLVLLNRFGGTTVVDETPDQVVMEIGAGQNWHKFVQDCVHQGLGGVENLSLIPGTVGAAPMQNIGAYGVEIKEVFHELTAIDLESSQLVRFDNAACEFGYRTSLFKAAARDKYLITSVILKLSRKPVLNTSYAGVREKLEETNPDPLDVRAVSEAVIAIRRQKLPDPLKIGNAGSFFKNPVVDLIDLEGLKAEFDGIPSYPVGSEKFKIPAAWLIEQCGWKGKRIGNIGVHQNQPLVLVNYGSGKGADLLQLARDIQRSIADTFGIHLEPEVNIV